LGTPKDTQKEGYDKHFYFRKLLAFNVNTEAYKKANFYISSKLLSRASKVIN
jgi:hypothetical protein